MRIERRMFHELQKRTSSNVGAGALIENGVLALAIILGFTVDWMIPLAVIPAMMAFGLFMAWRKK